MHKIECSTLATVIGNVILSCNSLFIISVPKLFYTHYKWKHFKWCTTSSAWHTNNLKSRDVVSIQTKIPYVLRTHTYMHNVQCAPKYGTGSIFGILFRENGCLARRLKMLCIEKMKKKTLTNTTPSDYNSCSFSSFIVRCFDCNVTGKNSERHINAHECNETASRWKEDRKRHRVSGTKREKQITRSTCTVMHSAHRQMIFTMSYHFVHRFQLLHLWWCF